MNFGDDDRAVVDDYQYGKLILYASKGGPVGQAKKNVGSMVGAGEVIQELIMANNLGIIVDSIFNKIYPCSVASLLDQMIIVKHKEKILTPVLKKLLQLVYRF